MFLVLEHSWADSVSCVQCFCTLCPLYLIKIVFRIYLFYLFIFFGGGWVFYWGPISFVYLEGWHSVYRIYYVLRYFGFNNIMLLQHKKPKNSEDMRYRRQSVQNWNYPPSYVRTFQLHVAIRTNLLFKSFDHLWTLNTKKSPAHNCPWTHNLHLVLKV